MPISWTGQVPCLAHWYGRPCVLVYFLELRPKKQLSQNKTFKSPLKVRVLFDYGIELLFYCYLKNYMCGGEKWVGNNLS